MAHEDSGSEEDTPGQEHLFFKFPRTRHLFNLGAASRDDMVLDYKDALLFLNRNGRAEGLSIVLEEKIDGANLGLSIDPSSYSIRAQNRSHFVNGQTHTQFKKLDKWLEDHSAELWAVLCPDDDHPPGRLILFGEWMYAKHSIHYTSLPDFFIAFDIFDTATKSFFSRIRLLDALSQTTIALVREITFDQPLTLDAIKHIVQTTQSAYCDGVVEGVYLRLEDATQVVDRAKVVRSDFIVQGSGHWTRHEVVPNKLAF